MPFITYILLAYNLSLRFARDIPGLLLLLSLSSFPSLSFRDASVRAHKRI